MWNTIKEKNTTKANLGNIQAKSKNIVDFIYEGNIKVDTSTISTPCSCTNGKWNESTNTFSIVYTPKPVPIHKKDNRSYTDVKSVVFMAEINGNKERQLLSIVATVYDNLPNKS